MKKNKKQRSAVHVPTSIRFVIWLSQRISNALATKVALYLFFRPQRFNTPVREHHMFDAAKKIKFSSSSIQKEIQVYRLQGKKQKVLLLHGWSGRGTQLFYFADELQKENCEVITFDMPAHGQSPGNKTNVLELTYCIQDLNQKFGPFDAAIAHSMGGFALLRAIKDGLPLQSAAIIGSGDSIKGVFYRFSQQLHFSEKITERMITTVEKQFGTKLETYSSSMSIKEIDIPLLIVHDKDDKEAPYECSITLHDLAPNSQLKLTSGLGHHRILRDPKTVQYIVQFLFQHP
ncbi:MAG: alpha/beta hydrolase [Bacteroidota bacterium]|nr:alpha/beta hydrolase [Bacteroidota bacterium]MEC8239089.1 alpha/beta hydrolase [Bacteroidota bacterium]